MRGCKDCSQANLLCVAINLRPYGEASVVNLASESDAAGTGLLSLLPIQIQRGAVGALDVFE